ncbi:MAG TPA: hypothetical protein VGP72_13670 [Planctomycetota bacterium]|jgi:hypothetical protein
MSEQISPEERSAVPSGSPLPREGEGLGVRGQPVDSISVTVAESEIQNPKSAIQNPPPLPTGDMDRSILSYLGLPFFYRHWPPLGTRRATFWGFFLLTLIIVGCQVVYMPYERNAFMLKIRELVFGGGGSYHTYEDGCRAIFHTLSVFSLIFSCIISPLHCAFSFSSERTAGTIEFLRLSPMPTIGVIVGKMLAPTCLLQLYSIIMLLIGCVFGWLGGVPLANLTMALMAFALSCITLHAAGALLAVLTLAFRGFGAVGGLMGLGFLLSVPPLGASGERGWEFIAYISPWGAFDSLFWNSFWGQYRYKGTPALFADPALVKYFVLVFHGLFSTLLIWAASRKLDDENKTALPYRAWLILWGFFVIVCVGLARNVSVFRPRYWEDAAGVMCFCAVGLSLLVVADQPHRRELVLANICECLAGREKPPSALRRMKHSLFIVFISSLSSAVIMLFLHAGNHLTPLVASIFVFCIFVLLMASVVLETALVGYESRGGRLGATIIGGAIVVASLITPLIHMAMFESRFSRTMWMVTYHEQTLARTKGQLAPLELQEKQFLTQIDKLQASPKSPARDAQIAALHSKLQPVQSNMQNIRSQLNYTESSMAELRRDPVTAVYLSKVSNGTEAKALLDLCNKDPLMLLWLYHPGAVLFYPLMTSVVVILTFLWRARAYNGLLKEAQKAMQVSAAPRAA